MFQNAKDDQTHFSIGKQIGDLARRAVGDIKYRQLWCCLWNSDFIFEMLSSHRVAQIDLQFSILLPQPLECWDCKCVLPRLPNQSSKWLQHLFFANNEMQVLLITCVFVSPCVWLSCNAALLENACNVKNMLHVFFWSIPVALEFFQTSVVELDPLDPKQGSLLPHSSWAHCGCPLSLPASQEAGFTGGRRLAESQLLKSLGRFVAMDSWLC